MVDFLIYNNNNTGWGEATTDGKLCSRRRMGSWRLEVCNMMIVEVGGGDGDDGDTDEWKRVMISIHNKTTAADNKQGDMENRDRKIPK